MKKIAVLFASLFAASQGNATHLSLTSNHENYAEIGLGTNLYYAGLITTSGSDSSAGISGVGWGFAFGHHFTNVFALEAGFLQSFIDINDGNHVNAPYATTRFDVPMTEKVKFIGKLGAMLPNVPGEGGLLLPFTGIGLGYAVNDKLDYNIQYQGIVLGIAGAGIASVGMTYRFE